MTRDQLAKELSMHAKECLVKLEGMKQIQAEYNSAVRALRVFTGEKKIVQNGKPKRSFATLRQNAEQAREIMQAYLKRHKEGATIKTLVGVITNQGLKADSNTVHNLLRHFEELGVLERGEAETGLAKIYKLKG